MASTNLNFAFGLQPQFAANGQSPPTERFLTKYGVSGSAATTAIYRGQCVRLTATGYILGCATAANFTKAGSGVVGVAAEPMWASSTQSDIAVWRFVRGQGFMLQMDNTVAISISSLVGWGVNITAIDEGSANSGVSISKGLTASLTSAAEQFKITKVITPSGGNKLGANCQVVVEPFWAGTALEAWDEVATSAT